MLILELDDFRQLIQQVQTLTQKFNAQVDHQKMSTIAAENTLKAISRKQEMERQELRSQIQEKKNKLDQMNVEYQMLQRVESQQREIIENFYQE